MANHSSIKNNIFEHNYYAIWIHASWFDGGYYNIISDNLFINDPIEVFGDFNIIKNNSFSSNNEYIISLIAASNSLIKSNCFTGNFYTAIYCDSSNNCIKYNKIQGKGNYGIKLYNCKKTNICSNSIENVTTGIELTNSKNNKIHYNNFINCKVEAFTFSSRFNRFHRNYWGRPRILPKRIFGIGSGLILMKYDLFPALKPYEI